MGNNGDVSNKISRRDDFFGGLTSEVTLEPKSQPAPRGETAHVSMSSGSDHIRSGERKNKHIHQLFE